MSNINFKDFAVAYSIFTMMHKDQPTKTNTFAKSLNVGFHVAKRVISNMSKNNLVKAQRGFNSKGVEKIDGVTIEDVFRLYNVEYSSHESIQPLIEKELSHSRYKSRHCKQCNEEIAFSYESVICEDCRESEVEELPMRIARCGHPSADRYFKCRDCQPILPDEEHEDGTYAVHIL